MHPTFLVFWLPFLVALGGSQSCISIHNLCICRADVDYWLNANPQAQQLINTLGKPRVKHVLQMMLDDPVIAKQCTLPNHAQHMCQIDNPCAFTCLEPYIQRNGRCACVFPYRECNGVCGIFRGGCGGGGGGAHPLRRGKHRAVPITTLVQAKHTCNINESVCGIPGHEGTLDFQCVDTTTSLDNCGGCVIPHPFEEAYRTSVDGVECARLRPGGVVEAACVESRCVTVVSVDGCAEGMRLEADGPGCVSAPATAGGYQVALGAD